MRPDLVIFDIDDTLFDWLGMWCASRGELLAQLESLVEPPIDSIKQRLRQFHVRVGTSEHTYSTEDLVSIFPELGGEDAARIAVAVSNLSRAHHHLFPDVRALLGRLRATGVTVVLHTDAPTRIAQQRLKFLELGPLVQKVYSVADGTGSPIDRTHESLQFAKPDARALLHILQTHSVRAAQAIYVGDSLYRDIAMAQECGVLDVYAAYGCKRDGAGYSLLQALSHWTNADIEREKVLRARGVINPTHVAYTQEDLGTIFTW